MEQDWPIVHVGVVNRDGDSDILNHDNCYNYVCQDMFGADATVEFKGNRIRIIFETDEAENFYKLSHENYIYEFCRRVNMCTDEYTFCYLHFEGDYNNDVQASIN